MSFSPSCHKAAHSLGEPELWERLQAFLSTLAQARDVELIRLVATGDAPRGLQAVTLMFGESQKVVGLRKACDTFSLA